MSQPITETDILRRARQILTPEEHWCQRALQRGEAYCLVGAIEKAALQLGVLSNEGESELFEEACWQLSDQLGGFNIPSFNDHPETTHEAVLQLLDQAIGGK